MTFIMHRLNIEHVTAKFDNWRSHVEHYEQYKKGHFGHLK